AFIDTARQAPTLGAGLDPERGFWERLHIDFPLLFALVVVLGFGMLVLYSAVDGSSSELRRQGAFIGMGFVVMLVMAQIDVRLLRKLAPWMYLGGTGLLVLVLVMGDVANGAHRWLDLPGLPRFQPSEIMKTVVPITVATWLAGRVLPPRFHHVLIGLAILAVPAVLTQQQPDLGTAILIATSGIFVILLSGINWKL